MAPLIAAPVAVVLAGAPAAQWASSVLTSEPAEHDVAGMVPLRAAITVTTRPAKEANSLAVNVSTPWVGQYDPGVELKRDDGSSFGSSFAEREAACGAATREMLRRAGAVPEAKSAILIAKARDAYGHIDPDAKRARAARAAIDAELDVGLPVMVGVMWDTARTGLVNGGTADHFVAITGRGVDEKGCVFYSFNDPGVADGHRDAGSDTRAENRFFVDEATGLLFRPKVADTGYVRDARYEVSKVYPNVRAVKSPRPSAVAADAGAPTMHRDRSEP